MPKKAPTPPRTFQDIILALSRYWADQGCVVLQPYDTEVGAGTFHPATTLRSLGPDTWRTAYVQPSRRPTDGRYGENPNRLQHYYQYQVILKPSPDNVLDLYLDSLRAIGIEPAEHDVRLVEDDWESPTLGAWGLGWEVWLNGMEVTQFTYFQQVGGFECRPVPAEITYGLERLAMYIQGVDSVYDLVWSVGPTATRSPTATCSCATSSSTRRTTSRSPTSTCCSASSPPTSGVPRTLDAGLVLPAYDYVLKCSHAFNLSAEKENVPFSSTVRSGNVP